MQRDNQLNLPRNKQVTNLLNGFQSRLTKMIILILGHLLQPVQSNILSVIISPNVIIWIIIICLRKHYSWLLTGHPKDMILHDCTTGKILKKSNAKHNNQQNSPYKKHWASYRSPRMLHEWLERNKHYQLHLTMSSTYWLCRHCISDILFSAS